MQQKAKKATPLLIVTRGANNKIKIAKRGAGE